MNYLVERIKNENTKGDPQYWQIFSSPPINLYPDYQFEEPFSFMAYLNECEDPEARIERLEYFHRELGLKCNVPQDLDGLPSTFLKIKLFPDKKWWEDRDYEIDTKLLCDFFIEVADGKIRKNTFEKVLSMPNIDKRLLSIVMFYVNPERYYPFDYKTNLYLKTRLKSRVKDPLASYSLYTRYCERIDQLKLKPYQISLTADQADVKVESISELIALFKEENMGYADTLVFYRGHADKDWFLIPSIFRDGFIENEDKIFKDILAQCPVEFQNCRTTFEKLVKMQHYSVPTRLLDITKNPLVALYFAVSERMDRDARLFRFVVREKDVEYYDSDNVCLLANLARQNMEFSIDDGIPIVDDNGNEIGNPEDRIDKFNRLPYVRAFMQDVKEEKPNYPGLLEPESLERVLVVKPKFDNPRIVRQDGYFFIVGQNGRKDDRAEFICDFQEFMIPKSKKKEILEELEALGISQSSLFPEIDKVAEFFKRKYKKEDYPILFSL